MKILALCNAMSYNLVDTDEGFGETLNLHLYVRQSVENLRRHIQNTTIS